MTKYTHKIEEVETDEGYCNVLVVSIFEDDKKIGEYKRNYSAMYDTFCPFMQNGEWFALYSEDYTATSVMQLPSCEKIAGEKPAGNGFCPVDYYVPWGEDFTDDHDIMTLPDGTESDISTIRSPVNGKLGFVGGCIWGDDGSWKIEVLDLSKIQEGILKRDARFGYVEYVQGRLKDLIFLEWYEEEEPFVGIHSLKRFNIHTGESL